MNYNASHDITEKDRVSPFQPEGKRLYGGEESEYAEAILAFCRQAPNSAIPNLVVDHSERFTLGEMATSSLQVGFVKFLISLFHCKNVLEIGTFIGSTTIAIAEQLPDDGMVTTLELGEEFSKISQENFDANPVGKKIKLITGDAIETLKTLKDQTFDFLYLDGAKQLYPELFDLAAPLISKGGLIIVDDVICNGDAINESPTTDKGQGTKDVVTKICNDKNYSTTVLPIFNGMLLATKL